MTQAQIVAVLQALRPGAQWSLMGNTYADIVWLDQVQTEPTAAEIAAYVSPPVALSASIDTMTFQVLFNHENRIRVLESRATLTSSQFRAALVILLGG